MTEPFGYSSNPLIEISKNGQNVVCRTQGNLEITSIKLHLGNAISTISATPANWNYVKNTTNNKDILLYAHPDYAISSSNWTNLITVDGSESFTLNKVSNITDKYINNISDNSFNIVTYIAENIDFEFRNYNNNVLAKGYGKNLACVKLFFQHDIVNPTNIPTNWFSQINTVDQTQIILYSSQSNAVDSAEWTTILTQDISNVLLKVSHVGDSNFNSTPDNNIYVNNKRNNINNIERFLVEFKQQNGVIKFRTSQNNELTAVMILFENELTGNYTFNIPNWSSVVNNSNNKKILLYCTLGNELISNRWHTLITTTNPIVTITNVVNKSYQDIPEYNIKIYNTSNEIEIKQTNGLIECKTTGSTYLTCIKLHFENTFSTNFDVQTLTIPLNWFTPILNTTNYREILLYCTNTNALNTSNAFVTLIETNINNNLLKVSNIIDQNFNEISQTKVYIH